MSNDEHGLALSPAHPKPRLKWTRQLHQCFVDAVSQLGGPDKATPKSVMRVMGIPGLTLYHLKSHLQKYRLAKNRDHKTNNKIEDTITTDYSPRENVIPCVNESKARPQFDDSRIMLQLQMEVQRKLQEQLEVQKHLQLRIEAQGKYLQSVLRKAQETLASYSMSSMDIEAANAELSELFSAVDTAECPSSLFSPTTSVSKQNLIADCSTYSCLTSSERPEQKNGEQHNSQESSDCSNSWSAESNEISFKGGESVRNTHQVEIEIDLNR